MKFKTPLVICAVFLLINMIKNVYAFTLMSPLSVLEPCRAISENVTKSDLDYDDPSTAEYYYEQGFSDGYVYGFTQGSLKARSASDNEAKILSAYIDHLHDKLAYCKRQLHTTEEALKIFINDEDFADESEID